ncbi:hypothetical protein C8Q73DRAFT_800069 [Cubamyces lactineus]|nr:hypothetical protein C8Q73DRAFT_800069 [Cubamyces lactineus]
MLSLARPAGKEYTECGVQTDYSNQASICATAPIPEAAIPQEPTNDPSVELSPLLSARSHSRSPSYTDSAYSQAQHTQDISFDSVSSDANRSMTTTTRAYKRGQLPVNRPTTILGRQPSSRVFSLPEATPKFTMKRVLGKKTARVVSMPAAPPRRPSEGLDISTNAGDPFGSDDEEHTRVRVKSQATDVPYTPSAPSSPDSVVIIANNSNQLSSDFLRPRPDDLSSDSEQEGSWLAWAESPPRPIPALHGPLSLPYARCPSGAEGTIIEEPESLPRVIWGLDADEAKANRPSRMASSQPAPKKHTAEVQSKSKQEAKRPTVGAKRIMDTQVRNRSLPGHEEIIPRQVVQQLPAPPDFILKHSEPIDLGRLVSNHPDPAAVSAARTAQWQSSFQHQLPTPELVYDLSPELQAMIFAQERLRNHGLSPPMNTSHLGRSLKPSVSVEPALSLLESIRSSRSPIALDDLAPASGYPQGLSSAQLSAFGLAQVQKYRQQQLQGLLPTPPSSSSPIWSSSFSPYQSGLLSPEMLAAAGLSQLSPEYLQSMSGFETSQHALSAAPGVFDYRKMHMNSLAPAAQINGNAHRLPPRLAAEYARRRAAPEPAIDAQQLESELSRQLSSPARGVGQSPVVPKPPPNTPYNAASLYGTKGRPQGPTLVVPPSPISSHETTATSLSQHARSIPLSKLMQRRLSIVPEEDYASSVDSGRTPPTQARAHAQVAGSGASGLHLYLSPTGRPNTNPASFGMLGDALSAQYGMADVGATTNKTHNITANVRLPSVPGKTSGPAGRGEAQAVKEAQRRHGSSPFVKDGGQRFESNRGRGQKRGGRGRRGRGGGVSAIHGAERVDGGMMVKS